MERHRTRIHKIIVKKKNKVRRITRLDVKASCATTACHCALERVETYHWNTTENPKLDPHEYAYLILD
jgi:hypothetical protein